MKQPQNVYDNVEFFEKYNEMRQSKLNANELIEIPEIKAMLPNVKNKMVLDLGCGAGGMSRFFAEKGAKKVVGLDVSQNMLSLAKQLTTQDSVEFIQLPMEQLSKIKQKFDIVFSSLAFHYIENFKKLIKDISNLLNSGGVLLFSQEHPIATAPIFNDGSASSYIEVEGKRYYLLSDYNNNSQRVLNWMADSTIKYHRNFSTILNTLIENKFSILEVKESQPEKNAVKLVSKYKYQIDRPYFLYIKAQKAEEKK